MEHITFAELAKIVIDNMPGSTQEEKLTKFFKWLANDHVDPKAISISKTTASRILNGGYSKKVVDALSNRFRNKEEFDHEMSESLENDTLKSISDQLKQKGLKNGKEENIYASTAPRVIYREMEKMIKDIAKNKKSSKFIEIPDNSRSMDSPKPRYNNVIKDINQTFKSRFPGSKEFQNSFSILVTHSDNISDASFSIDKQRWQLIKSKVKESLLIVTRVRYTPNDPIMQNYHPFGILANEELPIHFKGEEKYYVKQNHETKISYFVDEQGNRLKKDGKFVKALKTIAELNPPVPDTAYLCEITSFDDQQIPNSDNIKVKLICHLISAIPYRTIWNNRQYFGISDDVFFNTSNDSNYQHISNIDFLNRLKKILNKLNQSSD